MNRRTNPTFSRRFARMAGTAFRAYRRLSGLGALTADEISVFAANAGFTGDALRTAIAIALAESGGNPGAYNPETRAKGGTPVGQGSYGLWQIYLRDHPEFAGQDLRDPQVNANAAYSIWSRKGFSPWTTYTNGDYAAYLAPATTIDASTGQPITDFTPTPAAQAASFAPLMPSSPAGWILPAAAAVGAAIVADLLLD